MPELEKLKEGLEKMQASIPTVYLNETFKEIHELSNISHAELTIVSHNIKDIDVDLQKQDSNGFLLLVHNAIGVSQEAYNISLAIGNRVFFSENNHILMRSHKLEKQPNGYFSGNISSSSHIRELSTEKFDEIDSFYRFMIETPSNDIMNYIMSKPYSTEKMHFARGLLNLTVNGRNVKLCSTASEGKRYFIIDSVKEINFQTFSEICHAVMIGYGFITGSFYQNEAYYLKATDDKFKVINGVRYNQLRKSILTYGTANPIYAFTNGYTNNSKIVEKYGHFLEIFNEDLFSKLCSKILSSTEYATLLLLVIESNAASLIMKPAGYSVALEKITNIIAEENKGLKPIPNKKLSKEFIAKISSILEEFKEKIEKEGNTDSMTILKKNIDRLNSPTNRDKLTKPFEIYRIPLTQEEHLAIGNRNSFLHGRTLDIEEGSDEFLEIYKVSLRLHKLLCKLILKHNGFSGHIINHLKHNEAAFPTSIDEELFELI